MLKPLASTYSRWNSSRANSGCIIPTLWIETSMDYVHAKFGTGVKPDATIVKLTVCWFYWQASIGVMHVPNTEGAHHVR